MPDRSSRLRRAALPLLCAVLASACAHAPVVPAGEHDAVIDGVRLHYRVAGDATRDEPPILFLHGGPGYNSHSFAETMGRRLERAHRLVYLDQRGCGRSERPWDGAYSIGIMVEDIEGVRRALGVPKLVVLGHSFGGVLALEYAARHPEQTASVIVVDGFSDGPATFQVWRRELERQHPGAVPAGAAGSDYEVVMRALPSIGARAFFDGLQFHDRGALALQDRLDEASGLKNTGELSKAIFERELKTYQFAAFAKVTAPALIIGGRYDHAIGIEVMKHLAERLPRATFHEYEASAHFPYLEEPERFARDVDAFLGAAPR